MLRYPLSNFAWTRDRSTSLGKETCQSKLAGWGSGLVVRVEQDKEC